MMIHNPSQLNPKIRHCANEAGFMLIEILVAISIFAIGLLAVAALQLRAVGNNTTGRFSMDSMTWTANQFEQFLTQSIDNANFVDTNGDGTAGLDAATAGSADFTLAFPDDGRNTQMYWNVADNPRGFKHIRVITVWRRVGASPKRAVFDFIKPQDV
jgi:type IV pilus assembly protein PilV